MAHDNTCPAFFKIREGQSLKVPVESFSNVNNNSFANVRHQVSMAEKKRSPEHNYDKNKNTDYVEHILIFIG
jgi:hypothetical protein